MKTSTLLKRFVPYYRNYIGIMIMDLFCAALTTVCELVLPLILRYITNIGTVSYTHLDVYKRQPPASGHGRIIPLTIPCHIPTVSS